jgi:hypothetical protein
MATTIDTSLRPLNALVPSIDEIPKPITPPVHLAIDYVTAGSFLLGSIFLARRSRRAAVAAIACGLGEAAAAAFTDAPGGIWRRIDLRTHRALDVAGGLVTGAIPLVLWLPSGGVSRFFRMQSTLMSAVMLLTDYRKSALRRRKSGSGKARHTERGRR